MTDAVVVEGLVKRFGENTALGGVDLTVSEGTVLGLLGPNGAGKTTVVRILSTLLLPDHDAPLTQGWEIKEELDNSVDAVIDSGECGTEPTTVVDLSGDEPEVIREGAGDVARFV